MDYERPPDPPDDEPGEAWVPDDESGEGAWDDGSQELWDGAELPDRAGLSDHAVTGDSAQSPRADELADELSDGDEPADGEPHTALPPKIEAWRRRSATGAVLTGFAFGLQQVFETKDEPAIVMETSGDPPKDLPVEADLEYGRPRHSVVNIRPWLLPGDQQPAGEDRIRGDESPPSERTPTDEQLHAGERAPANEHQPSSERPAASDPRPTAGQPPTSEGRANLGEPAHGDQGATETPGEETRS